MSGVSWLDLLRLAATGPLVPELYDGDEARLHDLVHSPDRRRAVRAAVVLTGREEIPATAVARRLGVRQVFVLRWVRRYRQEGIGALL